ncbi:hypothetical protein B566_EDAN000886 [Ephemera danica]|nr:hypothetical protein B566_EDAN000886 [Ephemera danica]
MERWQGRVAIVTGASAGIGAGIVRALAQNGIKVVGVARRSERIQALKAELKDCKGELHAVQCDVTKEEDVVRVVKWTRDNLGGVDVLVNNAGVGNYMLLTDINTDKFRESYEVNVLGLSVFTREVVKDMRDRGVDDGHIGHIFHIGSCFGQRIHDVERSFVYQATKHAVMVMTEGLRRELRDLKSKIRITGISPGKVRSDIMVVSGRLRAEEAAYHYDTNPSLEPQDVADALLYALAAPPHVQVHEITILPVGQPALAGELKGCKGELHAIQGDVTKEEDVVRFVKWTRENLGGADVLVNNAGVGGKILLTELNTEACRKIFDTNVLGLSLCTREVIKDMRERGVDDGHIFHINSVVGQAILEIQRSYVYSASKHAVRVLTEGLRRELRDLKTKIRITFAVARGATEEEARQFYDSNPCLEAKDIADALLYALATPPHVQLNKYGHELIK